MTEVGLACDAYYLLALASSSARYLFSTNPIRDFYQGRGAPKPKAEGKDTRPMTAINP